MEVTNELVLKFACQMFDVSIKTWTGRASDLAVDCLRRSEAYLKSLKPAVVAEIAKIVL